jgi:uncharacterized protein
MNSIGVMYQKGQGVAVDYQEAMRWFQQAAAGGNGTAMYNIGVAYQKGMGVQRDPDEAAKWFAKATAAGVTAETADTPAAP